MSSNSGSKYTFMFFPRYFGPGIIIDTNMFYHLMHTPGGRFKGMTNTGQQLYIAADIPYGLSPSVDIATATLLGLPAFTRYFATNNFHASSSDGCIILSRYLFPSAGHHLYCADSLVIKRHWILGMNGRYRRIFWAIFVCLF
jgi:hypothetical protein